MEAEERPRKLQKLSHESSAQASTLQESRIEQQVESQTSTAHDTASDGRNESDSAPHSHQRLDLDLDEHSSIDTGGANDLTEAASSADITFDASGRPLSKNQLKRLRKKAEWESQRDQRKVIRKEKLVAKRERKKAAREANPESIVRQPAGRRTTLRKQLPVTIVIDCDFDDLMRDGERISLGSQITRAYSDNKNAPFRAHLTISSFGGHLRERFDGLLKGVYKSWKGVRFLDEDFVNVAEQAKTWMTEPEAGVLEGAFAKYATDNEQKLALLEQQGEIVYLSSESDNTLEELKPFSTYIVGGLVDKNRERGLCARRASQRNVRTAKLPIGQYLDMSSRKVLATNHVTEIMVKWLESRDWGSAFMSVIPQRRGGKLKQDRTQDQAQTTQANDREDDSDEEPVEEGSRQEAVDVS